MALHFHEGRERAEALSEELGGAPIVRADLAGWRARSTSCFAGAVEELGGFDVCAAVVGGWPEEDLPLWELPLERWEETLRATSPRRI